MLFSSFAFLGIFLPISLLLFWLVPSQKGKQIALLVCSLFYYAYWYPPYLLLLLGLVGTAWAAALVVKKKSKTLAVWLAAIVMLGTLAYFKYAGFIGKILHDIGVANVPSAGLQMVLPIGISFIVFQALGYVVDVARGEFPAEKRYPVVLLFKAFFPQLIAGPICRAHELMPQLTKPFEFRVQQFVSGMAIVAIGFFLKKVFADSLAPLVDTLYANPTGLKNLDAWAASLGFGFQIFADFWGYSTMAVGLAQMFSISIPVNFRLPYFATSFQDFWRRWHITLSQWLRDYLYKPLGGSRNGVLRTGFALMATMLLGGIWHGANYTFIIWGAIHGAALVLERVVRAGLPKSFTLPPMLSGIFGWVYTLLTVTIAWVFFRAADINQALSILKLMFSGQAGFIHASQVYQIAIFVSALFALQMPFEWLIQKLRSEVLPLHYCVMLSLWLVVLAVVLGAPAAVPFIYFQF